jgi:hypothetical protein
MYLSKSPRMIEFTLAWAVKRSLRIEYHNFEIGPVAELVGIEGGGVVSGVINLESSSGRALDRRPRHGEHYHEA